MSDQFKLKAQLRSNTGRGASRRLRRDDEVPAIIYGGEKEPTMVTIPHNQVLKAISNEAFFSHILTVDVDKTAEKVVLKDLQRHPYKPRILHMDFQRVTGKEILTRQVTLHFINENIAPGVKQGGGLVTHLLKEIEIRCAASNLPEYIEVDLAKLELNHSLHLSDLKVPAGITIVSLQQKNDLPVVMIELPRSALEKASETAEEAAPAAAAAAKPAPEVKK